MQSTYSWQDALLNDVSKLLRVFPMWQQYLSNHKNNVSFHLAIFQPPYLDYVLEGKKTIESRFSSVLCPPHGRVKKGDILLLKDSGGPVVGACVVDCVWFYEIDPRTLRELRKTFSEMLCAQDPQFWIDREHSRYASLMKIKNATRINPINCEKKDRRGWVILEDNTQVEVTV